MICKVQWFWQNICASPMFYSLQVNSGTFLQLWWHHQSLFSLSTNLSFGKSKMSPETRSGENRVWGKIVTWFLARNSCTHEGVTKSFLTGHLEQELQMVQLSAIRCSCITILWISLVSFATITLCVASQWAFIVVKHIYHYGLSPDFRIHPLTKQSEQKL